MSESITTLTLSFLQDHPVTAARVLDELESAVAVDVFRSLPARVAAPLLTQMQPEQAANVIGLLEPVLGASMVRVMPHLDCVTVLRLVSDAHRAAVFAGLPSRIERDVTKSLAYPAGTVGAWMEYSIAAFRISSTIADARRYLQRNQVRALSHVFIVGSGRCLEGSLSVASLLHLTPDTALGDVCDRSIAPLSNRARISEVAQISAWDEFTTLPVVGRKGNVLGCLPRVNLRRGLLQEQSTTQHSGSASVGSQVLNAWVVSASGLFKTLVGQRLH